MFSFQRFTIIPLALSFARIVSSPWPFVQFLPCLPHVNHRGSDQLKVGFNILYNAMNNAYPAQAGFGVRAHPVAPWSPRKRKHQGVQVV